MSHPMFLGDPPINPIPGCEGFRMHVGENITNTIVFIGVENSAAASGLDCLGTGFLLVYDDVGYLVTARHVATLIDNVPFMLRVNRTGEPRAVLIHGDEVSWFYHGDPLVDLAVVELTLRHSLGFKPLYLSQSMLVDEDKRKDIWFDIGDICYTVGLFHFVSGKTKNLPLVYAGNIALMPPKHEIIPVGNSAGGVDYVEAYLIESRAIKGASGSPVFVRPSFSISQLPPGFKAPDAIIVQNTFYLLGIFAGAWFLPPDSILREATGARGVDVVPVGLGVVIPAYKLIELLESEPVRQRRNLIRIASAAQQARLEPQQRPNDADNPAHREDFTALLNAAAKKPQPKD